MKDKHTRALSDPTVRMRYFVRNDYIRAYIEDQDGIRIDAIRESKFRFRDEKEIPQVLARMTTTMEERWKKHKPGAHKVAPNTGKTMLRDAYDSLPDNSILDGSWGNSYHEKMHAYFTLNILPALDNAMDDDGHVSEVAMQKIRDTLFEKSFKRRDNFQDQAAENRFNIRMENMNLMLERLYLNCFGTEAPQFPVPPKVKIQPKEQRKWLRQEVRDCIVELLLAQVESVAMILACALMFCAGLRTGEAAAVCFGDITFYEFYATLFVQFRLDNQEGITGDLKTPQSPRMVVLPYFFVALYKLRVRYLRTQGFTDEQISAMYIFDPDKYRLSDFSAFGRKLLLDAGLTKDEESFFNELMVREPDIACGERVLDVHAYIMRRDWATRMAACGMTPTDLDYLLGHENDSIKEGEYLTNTKEYELAHVMETYVYCQSYSLHPMVAPILVSEVQDITIPRGIGFRVKNASDHPIEVHFRVRSTEPGDAVIFNSPHKAKRAGKTAKCVEDPLKDRLGRTVPFDPGLERWNRDETQA